MTKAECPIRCGKKYIDAASAEKHADSAHPDWRIPKSKGWATPHGFVDFAEPVTYELACEKAAAIAGELRSKLGQRKGKV